MRFYKKKLNNLYQYKAKISDKNKFFQIFLNLKSI